MKTTLPSTTTLHAALLRRAIEAAAAGLVTAEFVARFIEVLDWLRDHGTLPTRTTNESLFKFCQRQRAAFTQTKGATRTPEHLDQIALFDAVPEWEWARRTGRYPDVAQHKERVERTVAHQSTYGELPNWDTDRDLYAWLRYCYQKGPVTLGPALAAQVEAISGFDWDGEWDLRRHGQGRTRKNTASVETPIPKTSTARTGHEVTVRPVEACPVGPRTPDPADDPFFEIDPLGWCKTNIQALALRDDLDLAAIAAWADVSPVAVHHWLVRRTGMGQGEWRLANGWLTTKSLPPHRVAWIARLWQDAPVREPIKRFALRTGIPVKQVPLVIEASGLGPAGFPANIGRAA